MADPLELDECAEKVYWAMLTQPDLGPADLAAALDVTEAAIRQAQQTLGELTLIRASRQSPDAMRAVRPEEAMLILADRQQADLERRHRAYERGRTTFASLAAEYADIQARSAAPQGERLVGLDAIQSKLEALTLNAVAEITSIVPGGPQPVEVLRSSRPLDEALARRGVVLRNLCQDAVRNDAAHMAYAAEMVGLGVSIRTAPVVPPRLIIVDREVAVGPLNPAAPAEGVVVLREPGIVGPLVELFERVWLDAVPILDHPVRDPATGLAPAEQELLRLLGAGATDEGAAKRLGVSLRTVRRVMADLMTRLGASSRFEAGLEAGRRGWL